MDQLLPFSLNSIYSFLIHLLLRAAFISAQGQKYPDRLSPLIPTTSFHLHLVLCSPTHPSLWYPLPLPCDSFHIFLSRLYAQARTRSFMHSPYVTDGLIKGCGWSGLVDRALIESSCLCNEFCLWTHSLYLCVCNYIYWLQLTQTRRLSVVTHQVPYQRFICQQAFSLNTVLPFKLGEWWAYWILYDGRVNRKSVAWCKFSKNQCH